MSEKFLASPSEKGPVAVVVQDFPPDQTLAQPDSNLKLKAGQGMRYGSLSHPGQPSDSWTILQIGSKEGVPQFANVPLEICHMVDTRRGAYFVVFKPASTTDQEQGRVEVRPVEYDEPPLQRFGESQTVPLDTLCAQMSMTTDQLQTIFADNQVLIVENKHNKFTLVYPEQTEDPHELERTRARAYRRWDRHSCEGTIV